MRTRPSYLIRDSELKGFVLVVTPRWREVLRDRLSRRLRAGLAETAADDRQTRSPWTPETARSEARRLLVEVAAGRDPAAARQEERKALTFGQLIDLYLAEGAGYKKPSTLKRP